MKQIAQTAAIVYLLKTEAENLERNAQEIADDINTFERKPVVAIYSGSQESVQKLAEIVKESILQGCKLKDDDCRLIVRNEENINYHTLGDIVQEVRKQDQLTSACIIAPETELMSYFNPSSEKLGWIRRWFPYLGDDK